MTVETQQILEKEIDRIVKGIEAEFGVQCTLEYNADYPPLYNDPEVTANVVTSLKNMSDPDIKEVGEYPMLSG